MSPKAPKPEPRYLARGRGVTSYRGTRDQPRAIDDLEPIELSEEEKLAAAKRKERAEKKAADLRFTIDLFDAEIAFGRPTPTERCPLPPAARDLRKFTRSRRGWIERCKRRLARAARDL